MHLCLFNGTSGGEIAARQCTVVLLTRCAQLEAAQLEQLPTAQHAHSVATIAKPTASTRQLLLRFPSQHSPIKVKTPKKNCRYNRQGRKANVGAGTATATEPTREHKQYATQGPTTYLCT